jgi:hypothetical protein
VEAVSQSARVHNARDAVLARPAGIDQAGLISAVPTELADHITRVGLTPAGTGMRSEGWDIAMVDLAGGVAFQPSVFTDTATARVACLDPGDLRAIAGLTLPVNHTAPVSGPVRRAQARGCGMAADAQQFTLVGFS